jgi:hypothetical protein
VGQETFPTTGSLDYGDYVYNTLGTAERLIYSFYASAGDRVTISLESDDFDTYLELRDEDGNVLITNDDGGDGLNSLIEDFNIPSSGEYLIVVRGYRASSVGDFYLWIDD